MDKKFTPLPADAELDQAQGVTALPAGAQLDGQWSGGSWGDAALSAVKNTPDSAVQFGEDIWNAVSHPIDTGSALMDLGSGIIQKLVPGEHPDEAVADAVGRFFVDRYGSVEGVKKTLATDPVGMLADLSVVLTGSGTLAARAPDLAGKVGKLVQTAGKAIDPLTMAAKAVKHTARPAGTLAASIIGDLGTHTGGQSVKIAARAGMEGGERGATFLDNLRAGVPIESVLDDAKVALSNLREKRAAAYRAGMAGVKTNDKILSFASVDKALNKVKKVGSYWGKKIYESADDVWEKVSAVLDEWRSANPAYFHTAEGFDALKKAVGDIRDNTQYGTPSRRVADNVYHAIRSEIVKQAPDYAKVMKDYERASDIIRDIEKSLSLNPRASVDTAIRKLQSVMRNNANTNYGRRVDLAEKLADAGAPNLMESLAGQAMQPITPRGLGRAVAPLTVLSGAANPWLLGALPFQSPRLMGEAAYYGGKLGAGANKAAGVLGPTRARAAGQGLFQAGRLEDEISPLKIELNKPRGLLGK